MPGVTSTPPLTQPIPCRRVAPRLAPGEGRSTGDGSGSDSCDVGAIDMTEPDRLPVGAESSSSDASLDVGTAGDLQLVVAIARYDQDALAEVYRRHGGVALGLAKRLAGDRSLAEEIVQEVFLRIWNEPAKFDAARGSLRAYLLAQIHGRSVDLIRSESSRRNREEREARLAAENSYDLEREVWDLTLAENVREALVELPSDERSAIELAYFGGHTYREVAVLLDAPEGTVKSRIRSGLGRPPGDPHRRRHRGVMGDMSTGPDMNPMDELLGAYALDAVDPDEREQVEAYLAGNPAARAEVDELRETAGWLTQSASEPPVELWDRIAADLGPTPARPDAPELPVAQTRASTVAPASVGVASLDDARARSRVVARWVTAVAGVAAAILIVVMGVQIVSQGDKVDRLQRSLASPDAVRRAAEAAKMAAGARQVALTSSNGGVAASIVYLPNGTGYLEVNNLPKLPAGETYQLWVMMDDAAHPTVLSAGVLGQQANVSPFHMTGNVVGFAVTREKSPGVVQSHNKPLLSGEMST